MNFGPVLFTDDCHKNLHKISISILILFCRYSPSVFWFVRNYKEKRKDSSTPLDNYLSTTPSSFIIMFFGWALLTAVELKQEIGNMKCVGTERNSLRILHYRKEQEEGGGDFKNLAEAAVNKKMSSV